MSFSDLGLSDELLRAVADAGYDNPTPIQEKAIPYVLMGRDIFGCAQTGTGKTASFTLPMLDILHHGTAKARMPRSLILEPTRELAAQVADNFETYGKYQRLSKALLIGGESMAEQIKVIDSGVDVLIATPGRLLDLFERGRLLLNDVKILVIDEADRMLDMGFIPDVEKIVSKLPKIRTTLMFSATMPKEIKRLADAFLMNPKEISVAAPASATITEGLLMLPGRAAAKEKRQALRDLIWRDDAKNGIIFCNRKRDVSVVCRSMERHGFDVGQLHGDMVQSARMETLDKFKAGNIRYLVCSDVAARGLDIPAMSHVFNFDVPTHAEDYVHRIGRTGRAGREGHAYTIALPFESKYIGFIEKLIGRSIPPTSLNAGKPSDVAPSAPAIVAPAEPEAVVSEKTPAAPRPEKTADRSEGNNDKADQNRNRSRNSNRNRNRDRSGNTDRSGSSDHSGSSDRNASNDRGERSDSDRNRNRNRGRDRDSNDDAMPDVGQIKGLGGHMPAFLMQAVPLPASDDSEDEKTPEKKPATRKAPAKKAADTDEKKPAAKKTPKPRKPRVTKKADAEESTANPESTEQVSTEQVSTEQASEE